jgi:hypothetical protein
MCKFHNFQKICKLISAQSENLNMLHIRMDSTGLLAIGRYQKDELHVEFNCEELTQNIMLMLHQVFNGYTMRKFLFMLTKLK